MKKYYLIVLTSLLLVALTGNSQTVNLTLNPYADVNWATVNQYKANYHTHTTNSDGSQTPSTVINEYYSKGYSILAITDHNVTTWPWPQNPGMLAVRGNEYSTSHHMNALMNFTSSSNNLENGIPHVQANGGRVQINHPGRYRSPSEWSWYLPWFRDYASCVSLEVFNQGDRYSNDRQLWDNINENYFAQEGKFAWGTSNDDKHTTSHLYGNFNFMLMPELTEAAFDECLTKGAFYFCYEPGRSGNADVPRISNIAVDENSKTITISASGYTSIQWIGPGTTVIATGTVFNYSAYTDHEFIRAVLDGPMGDSYTQPFGFETVSSGNTPPVCSITAPASGTYYSSAQAITITASASDSDGSVAGVEFFVNGTSIGADNTAPYSKAYSIPSNGSYLITAVATDNEGATGAASAIGISVGTVSSRIASSMDDVEERADGSMYTNSSDIELVYDNGNQVVGLRFLGLGIPQGATITSANIQFACDEANSGAANLTIKGHDADNSAAFSTVANNVSSRATTSASVNWNPVSWNTAGEAGAGQKTPDLSSIIQEIITRSGYTQSSAISIIITGTGERTAESYDGSASQAPLLTVSYTTGDAGGQLPAEWSNEDIGGVSATGSASYDAGEFTIAGSGADIWGTADEFHFVHQALSGDGVVIARVASLTNTNGWAKAGVMFREDLAAGSMHAMTVITPENGVSFQRRTVTGNTSLSSTASGVSAAVWVRIERSGNTFTGSYSSDGSSWTVINSETIAMSSSVYVGLCVSSHNDGTLCSGVFDNVTVLENTNTSVTASARISTSIDDVEEGPDGTIYTGSSDIELIYDDYNGGDQVVGLRFTGMDIPQGANITSANIQFTCDETNSGSASLTIKGHDVDNSSAFTTATNNVSSRTTTTASVSWNPADWNTVGEAGSAQMTPDLSSVVQEIVNRSGYSSNSALSFIITGAGERTAESYDGSSASAALLTVTYESSLKSGTISAEVPVIEELFAEDAMQGLEIAVSPNPVLSGIVTVTVNKVSYTRLLIVDFMGEVVHAEDCFMEEIKVAVNQFSPGIYSVVVTDGDEVVSQQIIIK